MTVWVEAPDRDPGGYCSAKTRAQMYGASYASSSWGCSRKATTWVKDAGTWKAYCGQHARMAKEGRL